MADLIQTPAPGTHILHHRGDVVTFGLSLPSARKGRAWLRTNLGRSRMRWTEIIHHAEAGQPILDRDWVDVPMRQVDGTRHELALPLLEVGRFQAKAFFLPDGSHEPEWPEDDNVVLKVGSAETCCGNTIYTAFVRQFGPNRERPAVAPEDREAIDKLEQRGYAVIPHSGTFRDLVKELDFILGTLRFRILLLLPVHPTPTVYARMGRFGSPFAVLDFKEVDPALAEFDKRTTPLDQFHELADAVHERGARLYIDIPINHTGWASALQIHHPEWFARDKNRRFQSPGAWGVTWEDLSKLDYAHGGLWTYIADVFLYWCRQGVDGFRCDAGYMIPVPVWEYVVAKVRQEFPDTVFLLEGLGGKQETVQALLTTANLDWAYSELFQNYDRPQIQAYLPGCIRLSATRGLLVHFAETHDNDRLAARSQVHARLRTAFTALCSQSGAFGITNGVEWFATEKVDVHGAPSLNWGNPTNQVALVARLNTILETHPCFHAGAELKLLPAGRGNVVAILRREQTTDRTLLIVANLDEASPGRVEWPTADFEGGHPLWDLVTGREVATDPDDGVLSCALAAGEVLCLTPRQADLADVARSADAGLREPERRLAQRLRAKALDVRAAYAGYADASGEEAEALVARLVADPCAYCASVTGKGAPTVVTWTWPQDARRVVMLPPGHLLNVTANHPLLAEIRDGERVLRHEWSLPQADGRHFALLRPLDEPDASREVTLALTVFDPAGRRRAEAPLLSLPNWRNAVVHTTFASDEIGPRGTYALCTNGRGAMAQVRGAWGDIHSQYDALLAANPDPDIPVDRHIAFTRCRAWLVYRGYSQEIDRDCVQTFSVRNDGSVLWRFAVPAGQGKLVPLEIRLRMCEGLNRTELKFRRRPAIDADHLDDDIPVSLILRPDIEDRVCHEVTRAYLGPEGSWPGAVTPSDKGFLFAPSPSRRFRAVVATGRFTSEPEWTYGVPHPFEADRGLDGHSDLFSPGYFTLSLVGGASDALLADVLTGSQDAPPEPIAPPRGSAISRDLALDEALGAAMRHFIVQRGDLPTVIAGYPWFLDWGRDTLICLRGMIADNRIREAREILTQFARFESEGTLPNQLHGADDSNRDTSDAPLWFFAACADLLTAEGSANFASETVGGRTVLDVLFSIATSYIGGTPNGIVMDPGSGLIFSPSHFTWMDTNHPAGTPREGYPIEIQALWHAALALLAKLDPGGRWGPLATRVRESIAAHFGQQDLGYLSDCLHAAPGVSAERATPDDALRPNQLLAVTLGALVDPTWRARVVRSCEELLVPGAIRSLGDRPVRRPLPIHHRGAQLNDPVHPYWGHYRGDENTRRKPAYHNGTAWTWLFPSYCEALVLAHGDESRSAALAILGSCTKVINQGCIGQVPEILDGDAPHELRGCGAQAWGVTELRRVLAMLTRTP